MQTKTLKTIWKVIQAAYTVNKFYFFLGIGLLIFSTVIPIANRVLLAEIIDNLTHAGSIEVYEKVGFSGDHTIILLILLYIVFTFLLEGSEELIAGLFSFLYRFDLSRHFIDIVYKKILNMDIEYFENSEYADKRARALEGFDWRPADIIRFISNLFQSLFGTVFVAILLISIIPIELFILLLATIPSLIVDYKLQTAAWDVWQTDIPTSRKYSFFVGMIWDTELRQIRQAKLLNIGHLFRENISNLLGYIHSRQKKIQWRRSNWKVAVNAVPLIVIFLILVQSLSNVTEGIITIGTFTLILTNLIAFKNSSQSLLFNASFLLSEARYVNSLFEFLEIENKEEKEQLSRNKNLGIPKLDQGIDIKFNNVYFKYPGTQNYILKDFNLHIEAGQKIAIVGENGAGKSTIIKLLVRFYDVDSGEILINNVPIQKINRTELRQNISLLMQDFSLYEMYNIKENIGFGDINKFVNESEEEDDIPTNIRNAAKHAKFEESIYSKQMTGYDTPLGRNFSGVEFSGGEKQRLALARTFYKNAPVVIMDEPTSAVDANGEIEIFKSIKNHLDQKTVIFVSHRFSTVRIADRIIVLENGEILEDGSHEQLLALNKQYAKLFNAQASGYK